MVGLGFLDGFRKWLHRNIKTIQFICDFIHIPEVGAALGMMDAITNIGNKITTIDLDKASADILDQWDDKKYTPFYISLLHSLSNNVLNTKLSNEVRAQFANDILLKIDAVKSYYETNENTGLSLEGIAARLDYINKTTKIIVQRIIGYDFHPGIGDLFNMIPIEQNFKSIDLSLLQVLSTTPDFNVSTNLFELSKNIEVLTPSPATVATHPPITPQEIENVIKSANNGVIPPPTGIPAEVTPPTSTPIDKTTIAKVVGVLLISVGLMSSSKSKSKSE